jgi:hypothetical protein
MRWSLMTPGRQRHGSPFSLRSTIATSSRAAGWSENAERDGQNSVYCKRNVAISIAHFLGQRVASQHCPTPPSTLPAFRSYRDKQREHRRPHEQRHPPHQRRSRPLLGYIRRRRRESRIHSITLTGYSINRSGTQCFPAECDLAVAVRNIMKPVPGLGTEVATSRYMCNGNDECNL